MLVVDRIRDTASGFILDRPGMKQVRQLLRRGPVDVLLSYAVYNLANAVGILLGSGQAPPPTEGVVFLGGLSLDGALRHTKGILPMAGLAEGAGIRTLFVPTANAPEAATIRLHFLVFSWRQPVDGIPYSRQ